MDDPCLTSVWARAHLRDLEDRYASVPTPELEETITAASLRFGVLCRFTAWLAVDSRVVSEGGESHRIVQPVELPDAWQLSPPAPPMMLAAGYAAPMPLMAQLPRPASGSALRGGRGIPRRKEAADDGLARAITISPLERARGPLTEELERLVEARSEPEYARRECLADLGSRLAALLAHLGGSEALRPLRDLVAELADDRPLALSAEDFAALWVRTLGVLEQLTASRPRPFWKRG